MSTSTPLADFMRYAYDRVTAVRQRFDQAGISPDAIQTAADLAQIPILPKDQIVQLQQADPPFGGMLAVPPTQVSHIFFSPGPIYEPAPEADDAAWQTAVAAMQQSGFQAGQTVLNSFSYHLVPAGFLFDGALRRLGCTVVPGGVGNSELQLKMAQDLGITGYAGTPSFLLTLLQKAQEQGIQLAIDHAVVSAEPLLPPVKAAIEAFRVRLGNVYATADFGIIGLATGQNMAFQLFDQPLVEIIDPDTGQSVAAGEAGEVVLTNFNRIYPLIRIGTGDLAVNVDPAPGQSPQSQRGLILVGRSGDAVKVRGMFVHPNQLGFAARQMAGVAHVQGVVTQQNNYDHFVLRVELAAGADPTAVAAQLPQLVQAICRVRVDAVEIVPSGSLNEQAGMVDGRQWR